MNTCDLNELHYYCVEAELHGVSWFTSLVHPNPSLKLFTQTSIPVIHNYPLVLALVGQIVEESYIAGYRVFKKTEPPAKRFAELGVYAYPLQLDKIYYKSILMSISETDYVLYKPQTRMAVPILTKHTVMMPGSRGWTVVLSLDKLPSEMYIRFGAKRYGVWRLKLEEATTMLENKDTKVSSPFNVLDISEKDYLNTPLVVLKHYTGDIAVSGYVRRTIKLKCRSGEFVKPVPFFI